MKNYKLLAGYSIIYIKKKDKSFTLKLIIEVLITLK